MTKRSVASGLIVALMYTATAGCGGSDLVEDGSFEEQGIASTIGVYQAEKNNLQKGCKTATQHKGYTGTGFVDFGGMGSLVQWKEVNAPSAGKYKLLFRYANGRSGARRSAITVNGTNAGNVSFGSTGSWTTWGTNSVEVTLKAGSNTIRVTANTGSGGPNLDRMDVMSEDSGPTDCQESKGCFQVKPTGTSDDSGVIQDALGKIENKAGGRLLLTGDFVIGHTVYLPSNLVWNLNGKMSLSSNNDFDKVVVVYNGVTNTKRTAITERKGGATNISMTGGLYDGKRVKDSSGNGIRFLSFAKVTHSKFQNLTIENTSDDSFTLHAYAKYNEVRNVIARRALTNGLNDKGEYNKWYDCVAEYCESDGWTPKCRNSEFHRCVARNNKGPGFGLYARIDGDVTKGAVISGNKFFDCEAYNNVRAGMSFNIADGRGPGAVIKDNYVQGVFYNNGMYGVSFRNKEPDGVVANNEVDILAFGNRGVSPDDGSNMGSGAGLRLDGEFISAIKGSLVSYNNSNLDMDLNHATSCSLTVYNPEDQKPAEVKSGSSANKVTQKTFSCDDALPTWSTKEYCSK